MQRRGRRVEALVEAAVVVDKLHPVARSQPKALVAPQMEKAQLGVRLADGHGQGEDDRAVVARPLESGLGRAPAAMDLHPVELVLQPPIARIGRDDAGLVAAGLHSPRTHRAARRRRRPPAVQDVAGEIDVDVERLTRVVAKLIDGPQTTDDLGARGRVRPTQGHLADGRGRLVIGDVALPDVEIDDVAAVRLQLAGKGQFAVWYFDQVAADVGPAAAGDEAAVGGVALASDPERVGAAGDGVGAEQVGRQPPQHVQQDGRLLVEVGVELHPPLLQQNAAEVVERIERIAREIPFHGTLLVNWRR